MAHEALREIMAQDLRQERLEGNIEGQAIGQAIGQTMGCLAERKSVIIENLSDIVTPLPEALLIKINSQGDIDVLKRWSRMSHRAKSIEQFEKDIEENDKE